MRRTIIGLIALLLLGGLPALAAEAGENPGGFDLENARVTLNSGYEMPVMGLGTYSLTDEECYNSVTALLDAGGRLIDTAYMYHNEAAVGRAVRDSGVPRRGRSSSSRRSIPASSAKPRRPSSWRSRHWTSATST